MKKIFSRALTCLLVLSFVIINSAYSFNANSDTLRSKASANTFISHNLIDRFLANDLEDAEGGFIFREWSKKPHILASGKYASLKRISGQSADKEVSRLNAKLGVAKKRLLAEESLSTKGFFDRKDFNVKVEVVRNAYKAATYVKKRDTIILDCRCFENDDLLYFKIKHELTDRKLPKMDIIGEHFEELPGLRELFTLITVDIKGFMSLRDNHPDRAKKMLKYCRSVGHPNRGLLSSYEKIIKNPLLNDAFAFTEDVFRLVESETRKAYFPNMRKAVRKIASKNRDGSINYEMTFIILRPRLKTIYKQFLALQETREASQFKPLTDFSKDTPVSLKPFILYAKNIDYKRDNDCIFLRVKIDDKKGRIRFAYLYIGLNDDWNSVLGKRGKIYSLTYNKWQHMSSGIFTYKHYDTEKERGLYWNYLIRLPITELINKLCNNSGQDKLKKLFSDLSNDLGVKGYMSNKKWLSIKKIVGRKRGPSNYYIIRGIIWKHIDSKHPKLFLGQNNLRDISVGEIPVWILMEDPEMGPKALSFLNPRNKRECPAFYEEADKMSMRDILRMLKNTSFQPMQQMVLFDADQTLPAAVLSISNISTAQAVNSAMHIAA
ncbi:MAG: hypothetical protein RAP41_05520 [Candidatus Orphnella occulta]|nr:hypothetical protein [Candidatus Orphnella occulta]